MTDEQWSPVPGFVAYEVSDLGGVRSVDRWVDYSDGRRRFIEGRPRQARPLQNGGHLAVGFSVGNTKTMHCVHTLVMLAFVGPRPEGMDVCHNNGDPTDNRLANLRYDTKSANMQDSVRHGTHYLAAKSHCKAGHPFDELNTIVTRSGKRQCRTCKRAAWRVWAEKRRQATARLAA